MIDHAWLVAKRKTGAAEKAKKAETALLSTKAGVGAAKGPKGTKKGLGGIQAGDVRGGAAVEPANAGMVAAPVLYVATNLESFETNEPQYLAREIGLAGTCYRRLDPMYYAWLRSQMEKAKHANEHGRLADGAYEAMRVKFNAVHAWATEWLGVEVLARGCRKFKGAGVYRAPSMDWLVGLGFHQEGTDGEVGFSKVAGDEVIGGDWSNSGCGRGGC